MSNYLVLGQCANSSNIYSFVYNGKTYEIIKENKTWADAASWAVERGGILTEINNVSEQNAIYTELISTNKKIFDFSHKKLIFIYSIKSFFKHIYLK